MTREVLWMLRVSRCISMCVCVYLFWTETPPPPPHLYVLDLYVTFKRLFSFWFLSLLLRRPCFIFFIFQISLSVLLFFFLFFFAQRVCNLHKTPLTTFRMSRRDVLLVTSVRSTLSSQMRLDDSSIISPTTPTPRHAKPRTIYNWILTMFYESQLLPHTLLAYTPPHPNLTHTTCTFTSIFFFLFTLLLSLSFIHSLLLLLVFKTPPSFFFLIQSLWKKKKKKKKEITFLKFLSLLASFKEKRTIRVKRGNTNTYTHTSSSTPLPKFGSHRNSI